MSKDIISEGTAFWDSDKEMLYFIDFAGQRFYQYSWNENTTRRLTADGILNPTIFIPIAGSDDTYVICELATVYIMRWDGQSDKGEVIETLFSISNDKMLDGVLTTAEGEIFTGTKSLDYCNGPPVESFYRYTRANGLEVFGSHYKSFTGIVIVDDILYHMDGCDNKLYAWDIHPITRALGKHFSYFLYANLTFLYDFSLKISFFLRLIFV